MGLDIYLTRKKWISYDAGETLTVEYETVYESQITYNLIKMADAAGIYEAVFHPEEIGATKASDIIQILQKGIKDMKTKPEYYKQFDSPNGWGTYKDFLPKVTSYLNACIKYPDAIITNQ